MMNKCSVNKRIVASILLFSHIGMSCSNHYNPGVDQNRLGDQPNTTFSNSIPNSSNSNEQLATLALIAAEEEAGQMISPEVDDKEVDDKITAYQASGPVDANLTLNRKNSSRIEKSDASTVSLPGHINNNNKQLRNQELVSLLSSSLNHELKDASNSIQFRDQAIISEKQLDLQEEVNQEDATYTQLIEAIQIAPMEVQQSNNHTLSIEPLQTLIDLQEEVNEEISTDTDVDEREQQAKRIFDFQEKLISLICHGSVFMIFTVLSFVILEIVFLSNHSYINYGSSTELIIMSIFVMLIPFFLLIPAIHHFRRAYIMKRMLENAVQEPLQ